MGADLGELKKIDLRNIWTNETAEFTPWLALEENIAQLGKPLGMELEVEETEAAVGPYSADILARDSGSGDYVVIENQLGKTDHDHLGKAITYAAALGASAVVWIAPEFTEEHKKALDWLNDNSSEDVSFFGVLVELWQIDKSLPALRFNVVSRPAGFLRRATLRGASRELTAVKRLQLDWWTSLRSALADRPEIPSVQEPRPRYWYNVSLGRSGLHLSLIASPSQNKLGVRLYMRHIHGGQIALKELLLDKEKIEEEVGCSLIWDANPEAVDKIVAVFKDADLSDRARWPEYIEWMADMTVRFRQVFSPRVKKLDLELSREDQSEEAALEEE